MQGCSITMKALPIILTFVLGGVAAAQPQRVPYDDHPDQSWRHRDNRDNGWTELVATTSTRRGTEYITVDPNAGRVSQLRVVANEGRVVVRFVTVIYRDGARRTYRVNRTLSDHGAREATVQLDRDRRISQIAVTTARGDYGSYGAYSVFGA